jgi:hypothetical protein
MASVDEARAEAIVLSGAMLRDAGGKFWNNGQWQLRVTDAAGNKICPVSFRDRLSAHRPARESVPPVYLRMQCLDLPSRHRYARDQFSVERLGMCEFRALW